MAGRQPHLRPAQRCGLALWVHGAVLAGSACQTAVIAVLLTLGQWHTVRQHLREWLYDGTDKAAPCQTHVDVTLCFAPLPRWLLSWWQDDSLRRDAARESSDRPGRQRPLPGQRHPRGLTHPPGQSGERVDVTYAPPPAPASSRRPTGDRRPGARRPQPVEPTAVDAFPRLGLAPAPARPAQSDVINAGHSNSGTRKRSLTMFLLRPGADYERGGKKRVMFRTFHATSI